VDESTPPESALTAHPSPTVSLISAAFSFIKRSGSSACAVISVAKLFFSRVLKLIE